MRGRSQPEATPQAEELAAEKDVDLPAVEGSGEEGRVLKSDVEAAVEAEADAPAEDEAEAAPLEKSAERVAFEQRMGLDA